MTEKSMQMPKVIFVPCVNSHRFERREIEVFEEVKVGRSVARCKTSPDNAIFDCKVLSRSHAVMWYQDGAIWIKDTNSSNGTFINNTRLSRGGEESEPFKIQSGDKIQFGVDVMEAKKKDGGSPVTHGCIIAKATVVITDEILPNPRYVTSNPLLNSKSMSASSETLNNTDEDQDILELHGAIKNAVSREKILHSRLQELEGRLGTAIEAAELGWQALIKEDKLLARIELLENQLEIFTRNPTEDQEKIVQLENEKHDYQIHAKDSLRAICQEKADVSRKCSDLENSLTTARIEVGHFKNLHQTTQDELIKGQDELRKKTAEWEAKEVEFKATVESTAAAHAATLAEIQAKLEELTQSNQELLGQRDELEKQLQDISSEHGKELESLQGSISELQSELETAGEQKKEYEGVLSENTLLKDENYKLQEELLKLKEELESTIAERPIIRVETATTETDSANTTIEETPRHLAVDVSTNTERLSPRGRDVSSDDQENQMNTVNIRDSMSQTEKWFDAISPSSSKSDIFSSSFTAGDKRYRSLRTSRREPPRSWSNSNAFEGSIAHAMALIESLDDIKSSCAKFREEAQDTSSPTRELSLASTEDSVTEDSKANTEGDAISPPMRRRNSYREACEDETAATVKPTDDTYDDTSEADEQYELAPEDHCQDKPSSILNKGSVVMPRPPPRSHRKVDAVSSSPKPDTLDASRPDSPNSGRGSMRQKFKGIASYVGSFWGAR